jgi:hypothetical protein
MPPSAIFNASITAAALFRHSSNSLSGTLSATIPAPERMNTLLFRAKAILIDMHVSIFPLKSTYPIAPP